MRHWTFGCAMTLGASMIVAAATVAIAPLAFARNLRRLLIMMSPLRGMLSAEDVGYSMT
jgi:hypothetical protein